MSFGKSEADALSTGPSSDSVASDIAETPEMVSSES